MRFTLILAAIVALAAALRLYDLSGVPTELCADELELYNSIRSIATTGHDVDGKLEPFLYTRFGRNPPMYALAGYASTLAFGRTPFGWRLPAALFGVASVLLLSGIAFELTRRRDIALAAAFMMATQPLFIHFSRVGWEPASELPFLLGAIYAILRARIVTGALLLGLTAYTYLAGWLYAAILGGGLLVARACKERSRKSIVQAVATVVLGTIVALPALWLWFYDPLTSWKVSRIATFQGTLSADSLRTFGLDYLAHFRIDYLVTTGDPHSTTTWRYLYGFGAFYWWIIPLAVIGLFVLPRYVRARAYRVWIWLWLLAYPLGGSLTNEGAPNAPRTLAGAPIFCLLAAFGFARLLDAVAVSRRPELVRRVVLAASTLVAAFSVLHFSWFYFTRYVHMASNAWDSGTRAMFGVVRTNIDRYDRVCFSVRPAWYALDTYSRFYLEGARRKVIDGIGDPRCYSYGTMLVTDSDHPQKRPGFNRIATIYDVDGNRFALVSGKP